MSKWGVFRNFGADDPDIHICPLDHDKVEDGTRHHIGRECDCRPRVDDKVPTLIIHNDRERGGFDS